MKSVMSSSSRFGARAVTRTRRYTHAPGYKLSRAARAPRRREKGAAAVARTYSRIGYCVMADACLDSRRNVRSGTPLKTRNKSLTLNQLENSKLTLRLLYFRRLMRSLFV